MLSRWGVEILATLLALPMIVVVLIGKAVRRLRRW